MMYRWIIIELSLDYHWSIIELSLKYNLIIIDLSFDYHWIIIELSLIYWFIDLLNHGGAPAGPRPGHGQAIRGATAGRPEEHYFPPQALG